jgi:hypothetical protein
MSNIDTNEQRNNQQGPTLPCDRRGDQDDQGNPIQPIKILRQIFELVENQLVREEEASQKDLMTLLAVIHALGHSALCEELKLKTRQKTEPTEADLHRQLLREAASEDGAVDRYWAGWRREYCRRELKEGGVSIYLQLRRGSGKNREVHYVKTVKSGALRKSK